MGEGTIANQGQNVRSHIEGRLLTVARDDGVKWIQVYTNKGPFCSQKHSWSPCNFKPL